MNTNPFSILRKVSLLLVAGILLTNPVTVKQDARAVQVPATDTVCRFGITSPLGSEGYDIASIGVGSYLDWGAVSNPSLPPGVEYIRVLRLRDDLYPQTLANLPDWVQDHPGSVWVVGNEPDTTYEDQDALLPDVYADRYYEVATIIRHQDPAARIAFGSVVQPTPIRLRYLDRAWSRLAAISGGTAAASNLIDLWSIHSFILNEEEYSWGTGIPPGFEDDYEDAVIITNYADTYSMLIFKQRVLAFRSWMANKGEREKPLWITEYGSLLPPEDPPGHDYENVSDEDTANYMLATFNFMLSATDNQTGLPSDGNQLVQRWFWYSLNGYRYKFGGTLFYPDTGKAPTLVGEYFIEYQANNLTPTDLYPINLTIAPLSYNSGHTLVNYRLDISIGNNEFADASCAQVWIYDGNPDEGGSLIAGPIPASAIQSNFGTGLVSVVWMGVPPGFDHTLYVQVDPIGVSDTNTENNRKDFMVFTYTPKFTIFPIILR